MLFGLMALAVASGTIAAFGIGGLALAILVKRRPWRWLVPLGLAAALDGVWMAGFGVLGGEDAEVVRSLAELPKALLDNLANAMNGLVGLPTSSPWGWLLLLAFTAAVLWVALRRGLGVFEITILAGALAYLVLISLARVDTERDAVATNVILILLPVIVPVASIPLGRRWMIASIVVIVALTGAHLYRVESVVDSWVTVATKTRPLVDTMGSLIAEGEPYDGTLRKPHRILGRQMNLDGFAGLLDAGWRPEPTERDRVEGEARVRLRVSFYGDPAERGAPEVVEAGVDEDGCVTAPAGESVTLRLTGRTAVTVEAEARGDLVVGWSDGFGEGEARFDPLTKNPRNLYPYAPQPGATAVLRAENPGPPSPVPLTLVVCGVVSADEG